MNSEKSHSSAPTSSQEKKPSKKLKRRPPNQQANASRKNASARIIRKYDAMWRAYREKQTATFISREVGVSYDVARRAIETGWPRYNLPALAERWDILKQRAENDTGIDVHRQMKDALTLTGDIMEITSTVLTQLRTVDLVSIFDEAALGAVGPEKTVSILERLVKVLDSATKLHAFLQGEPTGRTEVHHTVDVTAHVARVQNMRDEDLDRLIAQAVATQEEEPVSDEVRQYAAELLSGYEPVSQYILPACVSRETVVDQNLSL